MSVGSALIFPPSTEDPVERGSVRAETPAIPGAGNDSNGENTSAQIAPAQVSSPEDAVKVQVEYLGSDRGLRVRKPGQSDLASTE